MWRVAPVFALVGLFVVGSFPSAARGVDSSGPAAIDRAASSDLTVDPLAVRGDRTQIEPLPIDPAFPGTASYVFGTSVQGRPLVAYHRKGSSQPTRRVVVFGVIHGDEQAGHLVIAALMSAALPADLDLWLIPTINPDGEAADSRQNANNVDLNRNFPANWETRTVLSSGKYYPGPSPASEPETRATMALVALIEPTVSVWYHQPFDRVDCNQSRVGAACTSFATAVGSSVGLSVRSGTGSDWIMSAGHGLSFVYEFSATSPPASVVAEHVAALLVLARP
jgi:protein MpaA